MHLRWAHLARPQPFTLMKFHRSLSTRMLAGAKCLKIGMDLMGESCHSRPIRQNSAEILLRANLIQPPSPLPPLLLSIHIRRLKAPPCIHSIPFLLLHSFHSSIHWLTQSIPVLHFHLGKSNQNMEFHLRQSARAAYHPMNSLAPSKALLSGRPLAILGNLNGLL